MVRGMRDLKEIGLLGFIAVFYFIGFAFAVEALVPGFGIQVGLLAAMAAIAVRLVLILTDRTEPSVWFVVFMGIPLSCMLAGVIWWVLRLLGIWQPLN